MLQWTVYCGGVLIDLCTDAEVAALFHRFDTVAMDPHALTVTIGWPFA